MRRVAPLALALVAACGGSGGKAMTPVDPAPAPAKHVDHDEDKDPDDGVDVQATRGSEDPDAIQAAIQPHAEALQDCYMSKVGRLTWLGGKVVLSWQVDGTGAQTSAQIATSDLGAWPIEKCLLDEARSVRFPAPHGAKPTDFSVPFDFSAPRPVGDTWSEDESTAAVSKHVKDLAGCAKSSKSEDPTDVTVTLYVGTRGKVQSVGFASPALIADAWADCAEKKVLGWQLSDPKGHVAKLGFVYRAGQTPHRESQESMDDGAGDE